MEEILRQYLAANPEHSQSVREVAERDQVVPILLDWGGFYGIGLDGQVYIYPFDDDFNASLRREIEGSPRIRNMVFHGAAWKYPDLKHLGPVRQQGDRTCPFCNGTGTVGDMPESIRNNLVCYCGGLGWIPADDIIPGN